MSGETRYGISLPVSSEHAVAATAAPETPRTLRNSRRLTAVRLSLLPSAPRTSGRSSAMDGSFVFWLILIMAVGAVIPRLLAFRRSGGGGGERVTLPLRDLLRRVPRGVLAFLGDVAVHVTAHTPAHVEARVLLHAVHLLDLAVARLAGDAGVDVARVREVDVLGQLVNTHPRNGLRRTGRPHARGDPRRIRELVQLLNLGARARGTDVRRGTLRADEVVAPHAGRERGEARVHRLVGREVTVETVHAELLHVNGVREVDRLN